MCIRDRAAEGAFTARLLLRKFKKIAGDGHHAVVLVKNNQPPGTHDRPRLLQRIKIDGDIERRLGKAAPGRSADLRRLECFFVSDPFSNIANQLAQGCPCLLYTSRCV